MMHVFCLKIIVRFLLILRAHILTIFQKKPHFTPNAWFGSSRNNFAHLKIDNYSPLHNSLQYQSVSTPAKKWKWWKRALIMMKYVLSRSIFQNVHFLHDKDTCAVLLSEVKPTLFWWTSRGHRLHVQESKLMVTFLCLCRAKWKGRTILRILWQTIKNRQSNTSNTNIGCILVWQRLIESSDACFNLFEV